MKKLLLLLFILQSYAGYSQSAFYNPTTVSEYDMITMDYAINRSLIDGYSFRNDLRQKIDGYEFHARDILRPKSKKREYAGTMLEIHLPKEHKNYYLCIPTSDNHHLMQKFHDELEKMDKPLLESLLSFLAYRYTQLSLQTRH